MKLQFTAEPQLVFVCDWRGGGRSHPLWQQQIKLLKTLCPYCIICSPSNASPNDQRERPRTQCGGYSLISGWMVYMVGMISTDMKALWPWANFLWKGFELNKTGCLPWEWIPVITICYWQQQSVRHTRGATEYSKVWRPLRHRGLQAVVPLWKQGFLQRQFVRQDLVQCVVKKKTTLRCCSLFETTASTGAGCLKAAGKQWQWSCFQK